MLITEKDLPISKEEYLDFLEKIAERRKDSRLWGSHVIAVLRERFGTHDVLPIKPTKMLYEGLDF